MTLSDYLRRLRLDRTMFTLAYRRQRTPWDTNVSPPELVEAVEGPAALTPDRTLDIGCGTGTNVLYLARHGWDATGVDFAAPAITHARAKLAEDASLATCARFYVGDATRLHALPLPGDYTLLLDLGCLHGIPASRRPRYAAGLAQLAAPDALYLLYAFGPRQLGRRTVGLTRAEIVELFAPAFRLERAVQGTDTGRGFTATWYWLRRLG